MGQTLENGVYLPSEGERNCYAGLKTNWEILDQKVADVTALQQAVAGALHREIVESLPTTDIDPNTIYMVLSGTSATENVYNEYMYVNNAWELIGTSATDLANYYTKSEVDGKLLLKANDSDVVHKSGNETVGGKKTFSDDLTIYNYDSSQSTKNLNIASSKIQVGDTSNSDAFGIRFNAGASYVAQILAVNDNTGTQNLQLSLRTKDGSDNYITSMVRSRVSANGNSSFEPGTNDSISLGSSVFKWKSVYANNYYYGSNNVEFSTKFVTTDTVQDVAGQKTLVNLLPLKGEYLGTEASNNGRSLLYFLANRDTQNQSGIFLTKFRQNKAQGSMSGNDVVYLSFDCLENSVRTNNGLRINFLNFVDDIPQQFILWSGIAEKLLGAASAPWSDVYANKINGLTPSALGMPDLDNGIDISSYITVNGGNKESLYTPTVNGWISIALTRTGGANMAVMLKQGNFASSGHNIQQENGTTTCNAMLPVKGGVQVSINSALADGIAFAYFYPCLGNV